jgi:NADPH:quinone reductase-like Zn-dependent oxidoreductase
MATLDPTIPQTHDAVVTVAPRAPLELHTFPTVPPKQDQVLIHVLYTASTPLELHQADGGLLVTYPYRMGGSYAGVVVQVGPSSSPSPRSLSVGDKVFGFSFRTPEERCHQTYLTTDWYCVSKLPEGVAMEEAVSVPCNLITAFHALTADLGLELPWPRKEGEEARNRDTPILVWGAGGSVGNYALQVLKHWGYRNVIAVARAKHHGFLKELGANVCFDYSESDAAGQILRHVGAGKTPRIPYVLDCIGSQEGTLRAIAKIAESGTKIAIMLPVIVTHASLEVAPTYEMDVSKVLAGEWKEGVELKGTRTHFYMEVSLTCREPSP